MFILGYVRVHFCWDNISEFQIYINQMKYGGLKNAISMYKIKHIVC